MATKKITKAVKPVKETKKQEIPLTDMTAEELRTSAKDLRMAINRARLELRLGKTRNLRHVFTMRKQLSRVLTVLNTKLIR